MSSSLPIPFRAAIPCCMLHERLVRWGSPPRPPTGAACGLCASPGRCEWLQRATWTCCRCGGHGAGKGASGGAGRVQMWCGGLLRARGGGETQLFLRTQRCSQWHPPPPLLCPLFVSPRPPHQRKERALEAISSGAILLAASEGAAPARVELQGNLELYTDVRPHKFGCSPASRTHTTTTRPRDLHVQSVCFVWDGVSSRG